MAYQILSVYFQNSNKSHKTEFRNFDFEVSKSINERFGCLNRHEQAIAKLCYVSSSWVRTIVHEFTGVHVNEIINVDF